MAKSRLSVSLPVLNSWIDCLCNDLWIATIEVGGFFDAIDRMNITLNLQPLHSLHLNKS